MKNRLIFGALLVLSSTAWGADQAPKKFHSSYSSSHYSSSHYSSSHYSSSHPHHSLAQMEKAGHKGSAGVSSLPVNSQSARQTELSRLEHQNTARIQAPSSHKNSGPGPASHVHAESTGRSDSINFAYHPPHNQSATTSGSHQH